MSRNRILFLAIIVVCTCALLLPAASCSRAPKLAPTAIVTGQITLDDKPVTCGEIAFLPDSSKGTTGPMGMSPIGEDGRYEIRTAGKKGALVGWHKIRIMAIDETKPDKPWIIPIKYSNPDESGLTFEVKANQENKHDFPLKSKP
ncbi:MAG: hypothetical protein JW888_04450 [Pirellulales bacterium]|nr:hypothetical protein [Pirellulales bacterium]